MMWTLTEAVELAQELEKPLAQAGWGIGLTGSVLLSGGSEKDLDLIAYPLNNGLVDRGALHQALAATGFLSLKWGSIDIHRFWKRAGSTDRKHVEVWFTEDEKRIDLFILS